MRNAGMPERGRVKREGMQAVVREGIQAVREEVQKVERRRK